eukprot:UN25692
MSTGQKITELAKVEVFRQKCTFAKRKQAKNRNEIGSNVSLGMRLTRVKRPSCKHCCDTTPDRCQKSSRLTILFRYFRIS